MKQEKTVEEIYSDMLERNVKLQWLEPWPGRDEEGKDTDAPVMLKASARACLALERDRAARLQIADARIPAEALADFVAVHWATLVSDGDSVQTLPKSLQRHAGMLADLLGKVHSWAWALAADRDTDKAEADLAAAIDSISASDNQLDGLMLAASDMKEVYNRTQGP